MLLLVSVFAPTDDAFGALDSELLDKLLTVPWRAHLQNILQFHIAEGGFNLTDIVTLSNQPMINGEIVNVTVDSGITVNNATILADPEDAPNGLVYVIDKVLLPSFFDTNIVNLALAQLPTLAELVVVAGLDNFLSTTDGLTVRNSIYLVVIRMEGRLWSVNKFSASPLNMPCNDFGFFLAWLGVRTL